MIKITAKTNKGSNGLLKKFTPKIVAILIMCAILGIFLIFAGVSIRMRANGYICITEPSYGKETGTSYWTKEYTEDNGCISFKDEFGIKHKICGSYHIN